MHDKNYEELANAIIIQAVKDYRLELSIYVQSENTLNFQYHIFRFSKPEQI